jgi:hypothetical protein
MTIFYPAMAYLCLLAQFSHRITPQPLRRPTDPGPVRARHAHSAGVLVGGDRGTCSPPLHPEQLTALRTQQLKRPWHLSVRASRNTLFPGNNLPHTFLRQPKHIPDCLQRRAGLPRLNNCDLTGKPTSKVLAKFREHRVRLSLTFFLPDGTPGTRIPFLSQERGKCPV